MNLPPVRLSEIQTTDLIYYDPEFHEDCLKFCEKRDIDYLPSLVDETKFYAKSGDTFDEKDIPPEQVVDEQTYIFDPMLLDRFCTYKLLFVSSNHQLSGVVHFSDYNRQAVHSYLFNLLSAFERTLRRLFYLNRFNIPGYAQLLSGAERLHLWQN